MPEITFPPALVDLQRRVNAAWVEVVAHRREVDAADAALRDAGERVAEVPSWGRRTLPPWSDADDQEHAQLMAESIAAAVARRAGVQAAGLDGGYAAVQGLHAAARA